MIATIAFVATLIGQPPPPPTHHVALHVGGRAKIKLYDPHVRGWSFVSPNIVSVTPVHATHAKTNVTTMLITATAPGQMALVFTCDAGRRELWLIDVS